MDINMGDELVPNLDLNREPFLDPSPPLSPSPPSPGGIEDRIRQLEAVSARARLTQRWRRFMNRPGLSLMSVIDPIVGVSSENQGNNQVNCKRDISQLAKALEMDLDSKKIDNGGDIDGNCNNGNFFDCNICLDMAKDPILTCCGHLFCWGCFYQVPYVDSISKECPVCKGEVTDSNITPIYGNGKNSMQLELESGVEIPPRPRAQRVESVRQQSFDRVISHVPVADAIRRIRIGLGIIEETAPPSQVNPPVLNSSEVSREGRQFSRVISENPASFSSVSSALNNPERFVEDLETFNINERVTSVANNTVVIQPNPETQEINPVVPGSNTATTVLRLSTLETDGFVEIDLTIARPRASRRQRSLVGDLILEGGSSSERRRRLR